MERLQKRDEFVAEEVRQLVSGPVQPNCKIHLRFMAVLKWRLEREN